MVWWYSLVDFRLRFYIAAHNPSIVFSVLGTADASQISSG
jgi:hypothetical protein